MAETSGSDEPKLPPYYATAAEAVARAMLPKSAPVWERVMVGGMARLRFDGSPYEAPHSLAVSILKAQRPDVRGRKARGRLVAQYEVRLQTYLTANWHVVEAITNVAGESLFVLPQYDMDRLALMVMRRLCYPWN